MTAQCLDCGTRLSAIACDDGRPGRSAEFCSRECRNSFNNRRASRGAELYDLIMVARFERSLAAKLRVWGWIARLASAYRAEDRTRREGRPSWRPPAEIAARRPWITGRILDRGARAA